jgi:2-oxoacid:acceptor oxidoreductase gamma subunit (pyruvate/2-ketoisovalerate family)
MQEIRFHGRGGQGAVIGSEILARAFFMENKYVQSFPAFGVERRGAPVVAFCRVDHQPIYTRNHIYEPDHVVVFDTSLVQTVSVTEGLKEGGTVLINGTNMPSDYLDRLGRIYRIHVIDASGIAVRQRLGSSSNPIVNTAILGAFSKVTGLVGLESVEMAVKEYVPLKKEENVAATREAFNKVSI